MIRDGIDPGYLFENCETIKSTKKPLKNNPQPSSASEVPATSASIPAASASLPTSNNAPNMHASTHVSTSAPPVSHPYPNGGHSNWTTAWSQQYNAPYYVNVITGETSWTPPPQQAFGGQSPALPPTTNPPPLMKSAQGRPIVNVLYNFMPTGQNPKEIPVVYNDQFEVYGFPFDGWIEGRCYRSNALGIIPKSKFGMK